MKKIEEETAMKKNNSLKLVPMLAWRNVWKNKRRTILTLLTIIIGFFMILFNDAVGEGMFNKMIDNQVTRNTGHLQVQARGFSENMGAEYAFTPEQRLINAIENDKDIESYTKRIHAGGLISFKKAISGVMVQGIDPDKEKTITNIYKCMLPGGRYLKSGDSQQIIIGQTLAKNLGVKIGDKTIFSSQTIDGSFAAERLTIVGIFKTGNLGNDSSLIIMPIAQAAETFGMNDLVNSIVIKVKKINTVYDVRERLLKNIDSSKLDVPGWKELMPDTVQMITSNRASRKIMDFILFMIVAFTVLNTIQMSVFERIREFGVMLALGTRPGQITAIVLFESVYITFMGLILGGLAGSLVCRHFSINPIDLGAKFKESTSELGNIYPLIIQPDLTLLAFFVTSILLLSVSISFSIIPARKAAHLRPVEAIRHL